MAPRSSALIWSIIRRELFTRFGGEDFSYLWAIAIPLTWIGFGIVAFNALDRDIPFSTEPAWFLATGILPYIIFRQNVISICRATSSARWFRDLPNVKFVHLLWAFAILEGLTCLAISLAVLSLLNIIVSLETPYNALFFIYILIICWIYSALLGGIFSILCIRYKWITRALPLAIRPLFWISGVFFVARELPQPIRDTLSFNPLFILTDYSRSAFFALYETPLTLSGLIIPLIILSSTFVLLLKNMNQPFDCGVSH